MALGRGSAGRGGAPSTAEGHLVAFGGTLEDQTAVTLGLKQIGSPAAPFQTPTAPSIATRAPGTWPHETATTATRSRRNTRRTCYSSRRRALSRPRWLASWSGSQRSRGRRAQSTTPRTGSSGARPRSLPLTTSPLYRPPSSLLTYLPCAQCCLVPPIFGVPRVSRRLVGPG